MENMKNLTDWKLRFRSLMIEVTRMCNLRCSHCMRGEPQDLNITREILKNTFQQIDFIETLHLTGGEPFLYPELIEMLVDVIIETTLRVHRISTVDNGTILGEDGRRKSVPLHLSVIGSIRFRFDTLLRNIVRPVRNIRLVDLLERHIPYPDWYGW